MRRSSTIWLWVVLLLGALASGQAQTIPLLLNVKKKEATETTSRSTGYSYYYGNPITTKSGVTTVAYTVDVMNASTTSLNGLQVRWSVLVRQKGGLAYRVFEGKKTVDLGRGQKTTFDTDILELGTFTHSSDGNSSSDTAELIGYLVEAVLDGNVIATRAQPADIKSKVEQARSNSEQKRHRF